MSTPLGEHQSSFPPLQTHFGVGLAAAQKWGLRLLSQEPGGDVLAVATAELAASALPCCPGGGRGVAFVCWRPSNKQLTLLYFRALGRK